MWFWTTEDRVVPVTGVWTICRLLLNETEIDIVAKGYGVCVCGHVSAGMAMTSLV